MDALITVQSTVSRENDTTTALEMLGRWGFDQYDLTVVVLPALFAELPS